MILSGLTLGQSFIGLSGGVIGTDIVLNNLEAKTWFQVNPMMGITYSYYPPKNKPGIKFILNRISYGYEEILPTENIDYTNTGWNFQFLNIMYLPIKSFRGSLQMGPGISYFNNPKWVGDASSSSLPDFVPENINNLMLDIEGGVGISRSFGPLNVEIHSVFVFTISKVYKNVNSLSNLIGVQGLVTLQYQLTRSTIDQTHN